MNSKQRLARVLSLLVILALVGAILPPATVTHAATDVFINEIHYDNVSTDAGEAIEIAGPAGTDLTGWSLVLYNGSTGAVYNTTLLSGVIPDQQNGFGTLVVNYPVNGLQNGAPDGLALVDPSNTVVQFLSYEGTFSAVGGPADGMLSTDIGVAEAGTEPIGQSLQLTGSGNSYENFVWATVQPNTFGSVNTGQTFTSGPVTLADPLINEFVFNHVGADTAAFIEVVGTPNGDYSAYTVLEIEGDTTGAGVIDAVLPVGTTNAAGFWTNPEDVENGTVTLLLVEGFSGALGDDIDTNNDGVIDTTPWASILDAVAVNDGSSINDRTYGQPVLDAGFDGGSFTVGGASRIPNGADTDTTADWVRNDFDGLGLPSLPGSIDPSEAINTPGASNAAIPAAFTRIAAIQETADPGGASPLAGSTVTTVGVVTGVFTGGYNVFIQDGGGPWSGFFLYRSGSMALGDVVVTTGVVQEFNGLTEFAFASTTVLASGAGLPAPAELPTVDISQEQWESVLVKASNVSVTNPDLGFGEWSISDGSGDVVVDDLGSYSYLPLLNDALEFVQGPLYYSFGAFKIEPRNDDDIRDLFVCGDPFTPIYTIQGSGAASPYDGLPVQVEGVVVGDFQEGDGDHTDLDGFFIQDPLGDGDPATSDGIFVFAPGAIDLVAGEAVRVSGVVDEFFGLTEITSVSAILSCGSGTVAATEISLPYNLETVEGMYVTLPGPLYISEYFNFDRFGEIVLTTERQFQPTALYEPGSPEAAALAAANAANRITLDDGRGNQNPDPAIHPNGEVFDLTNLFRGGDIVEAVTGVLDYSFGLYRVQPTQGAAYTPANPRTGVPDEVGGNLEVASFNVLNYFTSLDFIQEPSGTNDPADDVCGPPGYQQECRGADTAEEFERQRAKIIAAISAIDADVVGLIEIENNAYEAVADLVGGLNDALGTGTYAYIDTGYIGTDAIKVALIYKPASVTPLGDYTILDSSVDPRFLDDYNRPVLAQTFQDNLTGGIFTAAVNHLKSKGSDCDDVGDPDLGDGAGNCNLTRKHAAEALVDWLASDPTGSGDGDFLIMGDLNSYDKEDPIDAILAGADDLLGSGDDYTDLIYDYLGEFAYSYVFDGQLGYLDHALASAGLLDEVSGTTIWHINADEPDLIDYDTSFKLPDQDALYAPDAYRSSDHDPVIVGLEVCDEIAPTLEISLSPDLLWPPNHKYVEVTATVIASDDFDPDPTVTLLSVESNEPDNGLGDGDTPNDIVIVDDYHFQLRAERSGTGTGRVYTITYSVTDACGNVTIASATVTVPYEMEE